jgi:hypothetical protein
VRILYATTLYIQLQFIIPWTVVLSQHITRHSYPHPPSKYSPFVSCYDPVEKRPIFVSTIDQVTANALAIVTMVLCQDAWNTVLGNTRRVQVIRQKSVASTMANPCCCYDFIYRLGAVDTHQLCNFLDLEFGSDRSGRPVCSLSSKRSLPCAKCLCHLYIALRAKASSPYACLISEKFH